MAYHHQDGAGATFRIHPVYTLICLTICILGVGEDPNDNYYRILMDRSQEEIVSKREELKRLIERKELKSWEFCSMKAIWFGQHLYQPLLHMQERSWKSVRYH